MDGGTEVSGVMVALSALPLLQFVLTKTGRRLDTPERKEDV